MPTYLCRWPNGDLSVAFGKDRDEVEYVLDEVGDPGCAELTRINHPVALHFHLRKKIANNLPVPCCLEFEATDELLITEVRQAYPILDKVLEKENATPAEIAQAVKQERSRMRKVPELSDDPDVSNLQTRVGMSKRVAELHNEAAKAIAAKRGKKEK